MARRLAYDGGAKTRTDQDVDTKLLNCFKLVVEHQSLARAARLLGITQPAASYQIAALERELGISLFRRLPQALRLTPQGRHFYYGMQEVLGSYQKLLDEAREIEAGRLGQVSLGISGHAGGDFVPRLIKAFRQRHPGTLLHLSRHNLAPLEQALEEGQLDVGVTMSFAEREHPTFGRKPIGLEPLVVLVPEAHPLAARASLTLEDLEGEPIVHLLQESDPPERSGVVRMFTRYGRVPRLVARVPDFDSVVLLVEAEVGLAVFPACRAATFGTARIRIVPLVGEGSTEEVVLVWNREALNPALEVLLAEADEILGQGG